MVNLATATASSLVSLIAARKVSSRELVDGYLERIERGNGPLNAVVTLDAERARARADALDAALARGERALPLHGLPITIKDAYETAGLRTTAGSKDYCEHVPATNAAAVQRLVDAGAVVLGKTNVPAYSGDVQTFNELFGVTNNPHDLTRTPGGSSGGAAVAVACGFSALELGSDIGGSIRTPSGWTGIYGHKSSYGIVPVRGHIPPRAGSNRRADINVSGPIARSAEDLALALEVLAGPDGEDARAYRLALPSARRTALREYRVGLWIDEPAFPIDDEVRAALEQTARALESAGVRVERVRGADIGLELAALFDDYLKLLLPLTLVGLPKPSLDALARVATEDIPDLPEMFVRVARSGMLRHIDWLRVDERRTNYRGHFSRLFERLDVLLLPITPVAAIVHDTGASPATRVIHICGNERPYMDLFGWIAPATACYLPATAAPIGRTAAGLPIGVQIVGSYLEDFTTIAFARHLAEVHGGFAPPKGA